MNIDLPASSLSEHNALNRADFHKQLHQAYLDNPTHEPKVCRLLREHCAGTAQNLHYKFEIAYGLQPDQPVRFAEALFALKDEEGKVIPSPHVLHVLQTHRRDLRLDSRFRFWLGFTAAEEFFTNPPSPSENFTHLSINIPAYAAASPFFTARFEHGLQLLQASHPGKGLIMEMLEHQPWNSAQHRCLRALQEYGLGLAVDDYGAPDGHHSPRSLQIAREFSKAVPPLVKIDGALTTDCLKTGDFQSLTDRLNEVQKHSPNALLVFEWVQNAEQVATITQEMHKAGINMPIHYVQSHGFNADERNKVLATKARTPQL